MEKKNNKIIIILMGVIIGVLLVLCVLFATDTITFNKKNNTISNEDATTTTDTSDINQTISDKITGENVKKTAPDKISEGLYQYLANIFMCNVAAGAALAILEKLNMIAPSDPSTGNTEDAQK